MKNAAWMTGLVSLFCPFYRRRVLGLRNRWLFWVFAVAAVFYCFGGLSRTVSVFGGFSCCTSADALQVVVDC